MLPESRSIADTYWAADLGCEAGALRPTEPRVQPHGGGRADYSGAFILVLDGAPIVSVPPPLLPVVSPRSVEFRADVVADPKRLHQLLPGSDPTRMIGPAHLHYADQTCFRSTSAPPARPLTPLDEAAFRSLQAACTPGDWEPKEFALDPDFTHGAFDSVGELLAVANFRVWGDRIAHLSVLARPDARGKGHGTSVVASVALHALQSGYLLQYRVLAWNAPSIRIAQKLGFHYYGWSMAARFSAA
jgi:RimJ/RimL family protein N-acetyltransferase